MARIRLYLDTDVIPRLGYLLRERGFDVISALEVGNKGLSDYQHLRFASNQGRTLMTYNIDDFCNEVRRFFDEGNEHAGVLLSNQLPIGEVLRRVLRFLSHNSAADMVNRVEWLHRYK